MFTPEQIVKKAEELQQLNETTAQALMDKFSKEQPFVLGYTLATGETFEDPQQAESLVTISVLIWSLYDEFGSNQKQVPEDFIYTCEQRQYEQMNDIETKSGDEFDLAVKAMVDARPQPVLNDFLNQEIAQTFSENAGMAFAIANVIVEAFEGDK